MGLKKSIPFLILMFYSAYCCTVWNQPTDLNFYLKPILIPVLVAYSIAYFKSNLKWTLVLALALSTAGDIFLLSNKELHFILGLGSFLLAHVVYIYLLFLQRETIQKKGVIAVLSLIIVIYLFFFLSFLWNGLGDLKIPVVLYGTTISTMLWFALRNYIENKTIANQWIAVGAFFFVLSDSLLATGLFHHKLNHGSFFVMSTYLLAQFALVQGFQRK